MTTLKGEVLRVNPSDGKVTARYKIGCPVRYQPAVESGQIYVGTESGKFFILRPRADRAEVLSEVQLPISTNSAQQEEGTPEPVLGGAAVSRG